MIRPENTTRKIDSLGRVTLPKGLRDRMFIEDTDELEIYTMEAEGKEFICLTKINGVDPKFLAARQVLLELGADIPIELEEVCK